MVGVTFISFSLDTSDALIWLMDLAPQPKREMRLMMRLMMRMMRMMRRTLKEL